MVPCKDFFQSAERGGSFGRASTVRGQAIKDPLHHRMQLILFSTTHLLYSSQDTYSVLGV